MSNDPKRKGPIDHDGRSRMFWDECLGLYRSWTDPFWFSTEQGESTYISAVFGEDIITMPHPRVWDYLVNGYGDEYRSGAEQAALFAEQSDVRTEAYGAFKGLEDFLRAYGFDLTMHEIKKGTDPEEVRKLFGPAVKSLGSAQKIEYEPYDKATVSFDTMHSNMITRAVTNYNENEDYGIE